MCEYFHRASARKISLKNGASTPTFSLPIGKFRGQVSVLKCLLLIRFAVCLQSYRVSLQRKKRCQQIIGLDDESAGARDASGLFQYALFKGWRLTAVQVC